MPSKKDKSSKKKLSKKEKYLSRFETLSEENYRLRRRLARYQDRDRALKELIRLAAGSMPPIPKVKVPAYKARKQNLVFHALRSDEQIGAKITAFDTNGIGGYDLDIYARRLDKWVSKVIQFKREDERALGLNRLVIARLGDWIEGETIYPGQAFYIDAPIVDTIFYALPLEIEAVLKLASIFREIEIFCVVGNHGRSGKKGDHHWRTSWEYIMLRIFQDKLKDQENVKVYVSESPSMLVQHGDFLFCYDHGGDLQSNYGVPFYSMDRKYRSLPNLYGRVIDILCVGHKHTPINITDNIIMNGSFMGASHLSVNKVKRHARAAQKIFYFDEQKGLNRMTDIYLEDRPRLRIDENGILTPYI